ncbi:MAG: hypothetical protein K2X03_25395 [Bryobacteraceae bacterium]|nr:hypothetical protein [Bryobacteraceae bacterium]
MGAVHGITAPGRPGHKSAFWNGFSVGIVCFISARMVSLGIKRPLVIERETVRTPASAPLRQAR